MKSKLLDPGEFHVEHDKDGTLHASNGHLGLTVIPKSGRALWYRHRVAKRLSAGVPATERMFIAELGGVRLYIKGDQLIMTKQDLYL